MSPNLCIRLSVLELQRPRMFSQSWNSCPSPAKTLPRQMAPVTTLRSFLPAELCLHVEQQHSTVAIFSTEDAYSKPYACRSLLRQVHISTSQEPETYDTFKNIIESPKEKKRMGRSELNYDEVCIWGSYLFFPLSYRQPGSNKIFPELPTAVYSCIPILCYILF